VKVRWKVRASAHACSVVSCADWSWVVLVENNGTKSFHVGARKAVARDVLSGHRGQNNNIASSILGAASA
jgi:hypothetical protein